MSNYMLELLVKEVSLAQVDKNLGRRRISWRSSSSRLATVTFARKMVAAAKRSCWNGCCHYSIGQFNKWSKGQLDWGDLCLPSIYLLDSNRLRLIAGGLIFLTEGYFLSRLSNFHKDKYFASFSNNSLWDRDEFAHLRILRFYLFFKKIFKKECFQSKK